MTIDEAIIHYQDGHGSRVDILVPLLMASIGHLGFRMMEGGPDAEGVRLSAAEMGMFKIVGAVEQRDPALLEEVEAMSRASMDEMGFYVEEKQKDEEATD
jgi:hypothetical protein